LASVFEYCSFGFSVMARASKYCIYCGGSPTTREHIWADWLRNYIPKTQASHTASESLINPDFSVEATTKKWGGDPRSRRLKIVCRSCNGGWMSELQNAAKPILVRLILGQSIFLNKDQQQILAAWSAMTMISAEYFYPNRATTSVTDRRWLFKHKLAPRNFRFWIGDYERKNWVGHWVHNSMRITEHEGVQGWTVHPDGTPRANTQTITFVVGRLFIHAFACPFRDILEARKICDAVDSRLSQIWWPRHSLLIWPPTDTLNDGEADQLTGAIFARIDEARLAFEGRHGKDTGIAF
jgi:hypothetical protein